MKRLLAIMGLVLLLAGQAFGWGSKGHILVANVATAGLGANAKSHVAQLLGNRPMSSFATWADDMRNWQRNPTGTPPASLANDPQAVAFFHDARNANQASWHFVNLPVGTRHYATGGPGTSKEDVFQTLKRCIAVLQGHPSAQENLTQG